MPDRSPAPPPPTLRPDLNTAAYIAAVTVELRNLATGPRLRTVRYLLDMARLEAERAAKGDAA